MTTDGMSYDEVLAQCHQRNADDKYLESLPVESEPGVWRVNTRLRPDWKTFCTSRRVDRPVKKGERFQVIEDCEVRVMTHWRAPFTGGHKSQIPAGTVLVADMDQGTNAPGFYLVPEDYEHFQAGLVPHEERTSEKYDGYSLSFQLDDIDTIIRELDG
jgi:hypothetical protein